MYDLFYLKSLARTIKKIAVPDGAFKTVSPAVSKLKQRLSNLKEELYQAPEGYRDLLMQVWQVRPEDISESELNKILKNMRIARNIDIAFMVFAFAMFFFSYESILGMLAWTILILVSLVHAMSNHWRSLVITKGLNCFFLAWLLSRCGKKRPIAAANDEQML